MLLPPSIPARFGPCVFCGALADFMNLAFPVTELFFHLAEEGFIRGFLALDAALRKLPDARHVGALAQKNLAFFIDDDGDDAFAEFSHGAMMKYKDIACLAAPASTIESRFLST